MIIDKQKKIILVETNLFFSLKITGPLKRLGYSVDINNNFEEIKNKTGSCAIIIDLGAKDQNPIEIIKKLKNFAETKLIPIIGFCGHSEQTLMENALSSGCSMVTTNAKITSCIAEVLAAIDLK